MSRYVGLEGVARRIDLDCVVLERVVVVVVGIVIVAVVSVVVVVLNVESVIVVVTNLGSAKGVSVGWADVRLSKKDLVDFCRDLGFRDGKMKEIGPRTVQDRLPSPSYMKI